MSGFPLNLDLSLYFDDLRKYSCVYVDLSKCKNVGDVEKHIKSVFKLEENICLTNKKFLIPSCEAIQILQQYETIKVQKCDFFDHQIHKNRRTNPVCDQTALNLIQTERTIDLSCRPKQRLKINICQNHRTTAAPLTPFLENGKIQHTQRPSTSLNRVLDEELKSQNQHIEKQRSKKKKHESQNEDMDIGGDVENSVDILDMSVKKSKRHNYKNCFSTDGSSELDIKSPSKFPDKNRALFGKEQENSTDESQRKSKKRKKHSHHIEEDLDLASSCWETLVSDNNSAITENVKRHKKKSKKCNTEDVDTVTDLSIDPDHCQSKGKDDTQNLNIQEDDVMRKKHKKSRKSWELQQNSNLKEDSQDHTSSIGVNGKGNSCDRMSIAEIKSPAKNEVENILAANKDLKEYKRILDEQVGKLFEQLPKDQSNSSRCPTSSLNINEDVKDSKNISFINENENNEGLCTNNEEMSSSAQTGECSEFVANNLTKRKRVRRHNKKKKRERNAEERSKAMLTAVGALLNHIQQEQAAADQAGTNPAKPVQVRPLSQQSTAAKHVFFTDVDVTEEGTSQNITPAAIPGSSVSTNHNSSQATVSQDNASEQPLAWQQELLKLAKNPATPLVFRRNTSAPLEETETSAKSSPLHVSILSSSSDLSEEDSGSKAMSDSGSKAMSDSVCEELVELIMKNIEISPEDYVKYAAELKAMNNKEVTDPTSSNIRRKLPVVVRPIPTDVQNIVLTNYPIIEKVVPEDLILFKVHKNNEKNEQDLSKTILARVSGTARFPEKVSLQIIEGCEECDACKRAVANGEGFIVELNWDEVLEPRLFYP